MFTQPLAAWYCYVLALNLLIRTRATNVTIGPLDEKLQMVQPPKCMAWACDTCLVQYRWQGESLTILTNDD